MGNRELIRKEIHKQSGREARKRFFFCYQKAGRWVLAVLIVILTAVNVAFGAINLSSRKGNGGDHEMPPANEDHGETLPGDLLFFVGYHDNHVTEGVGHVAIYLGNGKMIHAASEERGIVMDNYDYYAQPLCIRNVID